MATATPKNRMSAPAPVRPAEEKMPGRESSATASNGSGNGTTAKVKRERKYPAELLINGEYSPNAKFPAGFTFDGYSVKISTAIQKDAETMSGISPDKLSNPSLYWGLLREALQAELEEVRKYEADPSLYTPTARGPGKLAEKVDNLTATIISMLRAEKPAHRLTKFGSLPLAVSLLDENGLLADERSK